MSGIYRGMGVDTARKKEVFRGEMSEGMQEVYQEVVDVLAYRVWK